MLVLLSGRGEDVMLVRELDRESDTSDSALTLVGPRLGDGPNDSRLTPDVLSLGICLLVEPVGVTSSPQIELDTELCPLLRDLIVTLDGTLGAPREFRGELAGNTSPGPGSLERAR